MTVFWIIAGVMVALTLVVLARPLLRARAGAVADQETQNVQIARERLAELRAERDSGTLDDAAFQQARGDLEASLAADLASGAQPRQRQITGRWPATVLLTAVPALAVYLYITLGNPGAIDGAAQGTVPARHPDAAQEQALPSLEEMVQQLAARMEQQPDDPQGWYMLGRSYLALERYQAAADAFTRTEALIGDDPDVLVAHADALAMLQNGRLRGKPMELIERALARDPGSATALWLAGMGYSEMGQLDKAVQSWQKAKQLLTDPEARTQVQALIDQAQAQGAVVPPPEQQAEPVAAPAKSVQVTVALAPELKAELDPAATVFVFATPPDGGRMPVAALKRRVSELPLQLQLSDADALAPVARISDYERVQIGARVSLSGNAMPASGDLVADTKTAEVGADSAVELTIDRRVP